MKDENVKTFKNENFLVKSENIIIPVKILLDLEQSFACLKGGKVRI